MLVLKRSFLFAAALALSLLASTLLAQEDAPPAAGRGAQGGRGGRGGRGGGGRAGTREFLGLGPVPDEAAAKKGEPVYKQNCSTCHGETARGAQGPNLVRSVLVLHDEKGEEIGPVIKNGRPQGGMPGFPSLSQDDLYNVSQYIHLQVELAANRGTYGATYGSLRNEVSGDATKGEQFFRGAGGCAGCHSITGDLAKIGAKFTQASAMQSRFLWPVTPGPAKVKVTLGTGEVVSGTVRVMNDFDISITDSAGHYRQWPRSQVKVEIEDRLTGHRALLPKYTDADIHNLTAYLVTLKMKLRRLLILTLFAPVLQAQGLDPGALTLFHQPKDTWPTYNGDYSGRRFSELEQINQATVDLLKIEWMYRLNVGPQRGVGGPTIKSTPLLVNGILYFTIPDHIFAINARTGEHLWQYDFEDKGGHLVGQRGVGIYGEWLYFVSPDGWFISVNAKDGKERWKKKIADEKLQYFTTMAPLIVKNHVLVGIGGDAMDVRGYLESRDPETGELQWRWYTTPEKIGDPGSETWPNLEAMHHGGGMTWLPGTYDPDLNLLYWGTGNANPVFAGQGRKGANLWTASIVALNPDTGKLAWYFQASPHDTHDWDNVETPVLLDAIINGQPRKLLAQAARAGWFFVLDRTNGKNLVSKPFVGTGNWALGVDGKGQPIPNPEKEPKVNGAMIDMPAMGATNWPPPSYDPQTELFYFNGTTGYGVAYLYDTSDKPEGYGGGGGGNFDAHSALFAMDIRTGAIRWKHEHGGEGGAAMSGGVLTTAGKLLFTGDSGELVAFDPATGKPMWRQRLTQSLSNGPSSWMLDGKQYLIVAGGDTLYALTLAGKR